MRQEIRDELIKQIKDREQSFIAMKQKECENNKKIVSNFKQSNEKYEEFELKKRTNRIREEKSEMDNAIREKELKRVIL